MIPVIYVDDFQNRHYIILSDTYELDFLKERFEEVYIL